MADLARVKKNDTLMIPVNVIEIDGTDIPVRVEYHSVRFWLDPKDLEAAEHIPAPRVFKRGDWVRRGTRRHGLVYRRDEVDRVWVSWPVTSGSETVESERTSNLEPDEAPE